MLSVYFVTVLHPLLVYVKSFSVGKTNDFRILIVEANVICVKYPKTSAINYCFII